MIGTDAQKIGTDAQTTGTYAPECTSLVPHQVPPTTSGTPEPCSVPRAHRRQCAVATRTLDQVILWNLYFDLRDDAASGKHVRADLLRQRVPVERQVSSDGLDLDVVALAHFEQDRDLQSSGGRTGTGWCKPNSMPARPWLILWGWGGSACHQGVLFSSAAGGASWLIACSPKSTDCGADDEVLEERRLRNELGRAQRTQKSQTAP